MHVLFDRFEFDLERRALLDGDSPIHLSPKAFRLLEVLIEASPRAMSKEELTQSIWPDTFVEESNLASLVAELRTALGDPARGSRLIRTVHGFGYAFSAELREPVSHNRAALVVFGAEEISLYEGPNVLGRDRTPDVVTIDHSTVSRRHACITIRSDAATIEDLASKNGTFIGDRRIDREEPLEEGATVVLGDARLVFRRTALSSTVTLSAIRRG